MLVFDIDNDHEFAKRIPTGGISKDGQVINVKGDCASAATQPLSITTIETMQWIDVATRKILTTLTDETGRKVMSEKMVEVQWQGDKVIRTGDQFGVGRRTE